MNLADLPAEVTLSGVSTHLPAQLLCLDQEVVF